MMQRDINITIKLEGLDTFQIRVALEDESKAREAQRIVNSLYNSWHEKFPTLSKEELMGRIAFHMARMYESMNQTISELEKSLGKTEEVLDSILLSIEQN